jgi:serine/threonine protein phosphatase 1
MLPGLPLAQQPEDVLCGSTAGEELLSDRIGDRPWFELYDDPKPIVFGHRVVGPTPLVHRDRAFGIDTGACHGMRLTALVLPQRELVSVPAREDYWSAAKRAWQLPALQSRDWAAMPWADLDAAVAKHERSDDPAVRDYLVRVRAWASTLRGLVPQIGELVAKLAEQLQHAHGDAGFARAAAAHAAKALLFDYKRGRLDPATVLARCANPERTIAVVTSLGAADALPGPI